MTGRITNRQSNITLRVVWAFLARRVNTEISDDFICCSDLIRALRVMLEVDWTSLFKTVGLGLCRVDSLELSMAVCTDTDTALVSKDVLYMQQEGTWAVTFSVAFCDTGPFLVACPRLEH